MKTRYLLLAALPLVGLLGSAMPASADAILYNNDTLDNSDTIVISDGVQVSDSFTVTTAATADEVVFTAWTDPGSSISTVDWSIGTTAFGTDIASGNSTSVANGSATDNYNLGFEAAEEQDSFDIGDISLAPGTTYYLTLTAASLTDNDYIAYWNESYGLSTAELKSGSDTLSEPSESFEIFGITASPEPTGYIPVLLGAAMLSGFIIRRKMRRQS